jgi:hypothetical protein
MPANSVRLGPGTLTFGETGTPFDASCQLASGVVAWDKDADDPIRVLCGDTVAGNVTYTATLSGTFLQDLTEQTGLVNYTWENKGVTVPFEFVPNTAAGATVTGNLTIDPLDVGSDDEYGSVMQSDFEWDVVGEPLLTWTTTP